MTTAGDIGRFLEERFGGPRGLLVRDGQSETGLRSWAEGDTAALLTWLEAGQVETGRTETGRTDEPGNAQGSILCGNIEQTAELVGVSAPVVQSWLRRSQDPLPHIQHGRRVIIPRAELLKWIQEECERTIRDRED